jgi:hypothetical protein
MSKRDPGAYARAGQTGGQDVSTMSMSMSRAFSTSAVIPSEHAARRRGRRDDLIGLPTTWVIARIAARAT